MKTLYRVLSHAAYILVLTTQLLVARPSIVTPLHQSTDIAYDGSEYVAVTRSGNAYFSFDGIEWNTLPAVTDLPLHSVVAHGSKWLAAGNEGTLLLREPGEYTWQVIDSDSLDGSLKLASNGTVALAYSEDGLWRSTDGKSWTQIDGLTPSAEDFPVAWANGEFFLRTASDDILVSTDGLLWSDASPSIGTFFSMAYYDGLYFISGPNGILISPDTLQWQVSRAADPSDYDRLTATDLGILYLRQDEALIFTEEGKWEALAGPLTDDSQVSRPSYTDYALAAASDGTEIIIVGINGYTAWTEGTVPPATEGLVSIREGPIAYDLQFVTYGNDRFLALPAGSATVRGALISGDGSLWQEMPLSGIDLADLKAPLFFGNGYFLIPSKTSGIYRSTDGLNWELNNALDEVTALVFGDDLFVASATKDGDFAPRFYYSSDGVTWTAAIAPFGGSNAALAWNNGVFIGGNDSLFSLHRSTDGINWEFTTPGDRISWPQMFSSYETVPTSSSFWYPITNIAVAQNRFLIPYGNWLGDNFAPYSSPDGLNWSWTETTVRDPQYAEMQPTVPSSTDLAGSGYFLIENRYAVKGIAIFASDARHVRAYELGSFNDAATSDDVFVAVANNGVIASSLQDRPVIDWDGTGGGGTNPDDPFGPVPTPPTGVPATPPPDFIPDGFEDIFPNGVFLNNSWWAEAGYGAFNDEAWPWIYHPQHGWQFVHTDSNSSDENRFFYDLELGWIWSSSRSAPWFYRFDDRIWYYYFMGSSSPRWFYNASTTDYQSM